MYANNNPYKYTDPDGKFADCFFCKNPQYPTNGTPTRQTAEGKMAEQAGANNVAEFNDTTAGETATEVGNKLPGAGGVVAAVVGTILQSAEGNDMTSTASGVIVGVTASTIAEDVLTDSGKNSSNLKTKAISSVIGVVLGAVSSANEKNNAAEQKEQTKQTEEKE